MTADSLVLTGYNSTLQRSSMEKTLLFYQQMDFSPQGCGSPKFRAGIFDPVSPFDNFNSDKHPSLCESSCDSNSSNNSSGSSGDSDHVIIVNNLNRPCEADLVKEFGHLREPSSHVTNYACVGVSPKKNVHFDLIYERLHLTGWFYPHLTMYEAKCKLRDCQPGTFLLRNSSDPTRLFSLSVKTKRGTTSIRIQIHNGLFSLESDPTSSSPTPSSDCVVKLVECYVKAREEKAARKRQETGRSSLDKFVLLETTGRMDTPLTLERGLTTQPHSLAHLSRLAFNRQSELRKTNKLKFVAPKIEEYLCQYPYSV